MAAVQALIGFLTLILGRQYYPVYVGAITFMMAKLYIPQIFPQQSVNNILVTSIVVGVIIGGLSISLKRILVIAASFLVGGSLVFGAADLLGLGPAFQTWGVFLIAGAFGALLALLVFDFGVIFLSAVYGATLILERLHMPGFTPLVWLIMLTIFGIIVQWVLLQYGHPEPD
jgi:hypothetical protein